MELKEKLPVSYLLFTKRGRIDRLTYWTVSIFIWSTFYVLFNLLNSLVSFSATWILYPLLYWALIATASKRLHDVNISGFWLALVAIPVLGPLILFFILGFKKGKLNNNKFGTSPNLASDYLQTNEPDKITHLKTDERVVNDISQLNPVIVSKVETPESVEELIRIIKTSNLPVSLGGGRFSMGGQTASSGCVHVSMRKLNRVIDFSAEKKTIKVEAGARWCDIQKFIDPHDLSIKIMQTYANFTVGGSLSVNCHGRYIGLGPLILSVKSLDIILPNGDFVNVSRENNQELFNASIGCYNAVSVIVAAEFELADNVLLKRIHKTMAVTEYPSYFETQIRNNPSIVLHNGDIYPPRYKKIRAVSWVKTTRKPTVKARLMPIAASYPVERFFISAFSKSSFGKWRRQFIYDPVLYFKTKVHWRNYEAGYDVAELEPASRKDHTFVLQEYFVPVKKYNDFAPMMAEIFSRYKVNVINISIRHAFEDKESLLSWAKEEVFAFVIWYKQGTNELEKNKVGIWTRELIDAALPLNGSYYLPYQIHATPEQFHKAYPHAQQLTELKQQLDPESKFRNALWDTYYLSKENQVMSEPQSEFKAVFSNTKWSDDFYRFLQVVFHLYPEDQFHHLIASVSKEKSTDEEIYQSVQSQLPKIKPFLSEIRLALPALKKQKREMTGQVLKILSTRKNINGYLEIGSTGRYISHLRKYITLTGNVYLTNDIEPSNALADIFERGGIRKAGQFFNINDYQPISAEQIADNSIDLVTCHIGLHHCPEELLAGYLKSINRILRKGGLFIIRDHDVKTEEMRVFVSLVHTVFNLGLNETWNKSDSEHKSFKSIEEWSKIICSHGFSDTGARILQQNDPSDNTLAAFIKQ
jgi:FAD/FMN-containing dehydrogenase/uncharacterized membrane protein YhaH (DUF805 family)/SAM-dependent methyltransferase